MKVDVIVAAHPPLRGERTHLRMLELGALGLIAQLAQEHTCRLPIVG